MKDSVGFHEGDRSDERQNGGMPARRHVPEMPERVQAIHYVLGAPSRLEVLRYLLDHGQSTRQQIADDTGLSLPQTGVTLRQLASNGYVEADIPEGERVGRAPRYSANRKKVLDDAGAFFAWLAE